MKNTILHCGVCGELLNFNSNTLETKPMTIPPKQTSIITILKHTKKYGYYADKNWYTYVVFPCLCQPDEQGNVIKYYLTAPEYYELIKLLKERQKTWEMSLKK